MQAAQIEPFLQQEWGQINDKLASLLNQQISRILESPHAQSLFNRSATLQPGNTTGGANSGIGQAIQQQLGNRIGDNLSGQIDEKASSEYLRRLTVTLVEPDWY